MRKALILLFLVLLLPACATQRFVLQQGEEGVRHESTAHFFISGIGQEKEIDPAAVCGSREKVLRMETYRSFLNQLLAIITYGIYTPAQATVYCRA